MRLLLVLLFAANIAHAETPPARALPSTATAEGREDARRLFLAGRQAYQDSRYEMAIASFEAANRIIPDARMLFNLAQAYRKQFLVTQEPEILLRAMTDYRRFLREAIDAAPANREAATQALSDLLPLSARLPPPSSNGEAIVPVAALPVREVKTEVMVVTEAEGGRVLLDGAPSAPAPLLATVTPGEHRAVVDAPGYFPSEVKLSAVAGRLVVGEARLLPKPGRIELSGGRGANLFLDGQPVGELPLHAPLEAAAGRHFVAAIERGHDPWSTQLDLGRGTVALLHPELHASAQRRAAHWMAAITGLAIVGTAAPLGVWLEADGAAATLNQKRLTTGITPAELTLYTEDRNRRDAWRTGTLVAFGITGALGVIAAALDLFDRPDPPRYVAGSP